MRIIRACREAGLQCVTVYSTADRTALHAEIADESVCIGPPSVQDSYLNMNALISACQNTGATALHPGFGFLSESAEFAQLCIDNGITFIGPSPESISMLGDKARAKETMKAAGVPVIPGSDGAISSVEEAKKIAAEIGYPVLVKASAGGGGRGIRRIDREDQLEEQMSVAKEEAKLFFGNDEVYLEKLIVGPHHVEIQIIADQMGNTVALGERDCSMQRRNQKVLEESPSPLMTPELRKAMQEAAVRAAKACGYYNAGTIEFLVDDDRNFYFMEMNTRIQVEHPVTEWVTGVDLVQTQLLVAQGKPLPFTQEDIQVRGHQCGKSGAGLPSLARKDPVAPYPRRSGNPCGQCCVSGLHHSAVLRFHDRKADRPCPDPQSGDHENAVGTGGIYRGRHRFQY